MIDDDRENRRQLNERQYESHDEQTERWLTGAAIIFGIFIVAWAIYGLAVDDNPHGGVEQTIFETRDNWGN